MSKHVKQILLEHERFNMNSLTLSLIIVFNFFGSLAINDARNRYGEWAAVETEANIWLTTRMKVTTNVRNIAANIRIRGFVSLAVIIINQISINGMIM